MQFSFEISSDHPALPGHFPGAPVVPAVVLIEQLAQRLERITGRPVYAIRQLRLLGLIEPGALIDVEGREKSPGRWRLACKVGDRVVAKGTFTSEPPEAPEPAGQSTREPESQSAAFAYEQLPHAGDMRLVSEFCVLDKGAQTRATVAPGHPLLADKGLPTWAMLEYAAQLMACRKISLSGEAMRKAVVVLVRSLQRHVEGPVAIGEQVVVSVTEEVGQPGAVQCAFTATDGSQLIASGEFTVLSEN